MERQRIPEGWQPGDRCERALAALGVAACVYRGTLPEDASRLRRVLSGAVAYGAVIATDHILFGRQRQRRSREQHQVA